MAEAVLFSIAEGILTDLAAEALKQIRLPFGVKDELRKLRATITTIKAVLLDAEEKRAINNQVKLWLDSLEDVIYDADNLIDEFRYQQLKRKVLFGKKRAKKVRIFFSSSNQLVFRLKMAKKIKQIRETLDEIKGNRQFHLDERLEETRVVSPMSWRETHSFVIDSEVIGREEDKKDLLGLLLDNNIDNEENVSVVSLVGLGGLGKTTLAQFVFNDESVKKHFEKQMWVCVSDVFDVKLLVKKILRSLDNERSYGDSDLEQLQSQLREKIGDKRYLLVLDDVWNEDSDRWDRLRTFLKLGARGSKVLVTTRSVNVARIVHSSKTHMLSGLDKDKSWTLFERLAFEDRNYAPIDYPHLLEIGKDIVAKCIGVPLAIKTVGRLLKSKINSLQMLDVRKWISFRDVELAKVDYENETDILPTLELSYNNLPSHLKHCFAYSSLFPKDHMIDVQELIRLWIAQGFVKPIRNESQLEEIGYEYFMILFWGCFFQEAKMDNFLGSIKYCKMHDLMHDLASLVAGKSIEILNVGVDKYEGTISAMIDTDVKNSFEKVHHVYVDFNSDSSQIPLSLFGQKKMRSFILPESKSFSSSDFDSIVSNFKFLRAMSLKKLEILSNSLGKLKHLRYLSLSGNMRKLPNSITGLYNLQTLILSSCNELECLPPDIQNLINLRHLEIDSCFGLTHMPPLHHLSSLKELKFKWLLALDYVSEWDNDWNRGDHPSTSSMSSTTSFFPSLTKLTIDECPNLQGWWGREREDFDEAVEPYFPNLSELLISNCPRLTSMPLFPNLEKLDLQSSSWKPLEGTIKMKLKSESSVAATSSAATSSSSSAALSKLKDLIIIKVDDLESIPEEIRNLSSLQNLEIYSCNNLISLPEGISNLKSLQNLQISHCPNFTSLPEGISNLKSLQNLQISECNNLTSLPEGISNLKSLQNLEISYCDNLTSLPEGISNLKSLQNLKISCCNNLTSLPEGISNLKSLQNLWIFSCNNLTSLPEGISNLKSLQNLQIWYCNKLTSLPERIRSLPFLEYMR